MTPRAFLLFSLVPLALAALVLSFGAPMVVQCRRVAPTSGEWAPALEREDRGVQENATRGRVDVDVRQRFLGLLTIRRATLSNVVAADAHAVRARRRKRGGDMGTVITLVTRDGRKCTSPPAYSPIGTRPHEMAARIEQFINQSSPQSLRMWCASWVLHLAGLPVLFIGLLFAYAGLNVLRTNLAAGRRLNAAFK